MKLDFYKIVEQFIVNKETFKLIFQNEIKPVINPTTRQILILDSSFNPPHLGHLSMIKQGVIDIKSPGINISTINYKSILLLFSVHNADKGIADVASYSTRLEMMKEMCDFIDEEMGLACGIGLTNASLFVDKGESICAWVNDQNIEKIFLVGYDTVVRIFDPKYYQDSVDQEMISFFTKSKICVFLRDTGNCDFELQKEYLLKLQQKWGPDKILVTHADHREMKISSSAIRRKLKSGDSSWTEDVIPAIRRLLESKSVKVDR